MVSFICVARLNPGKGRDEKNPPLRGAEKATKRFKYRESEVARSVRLPETVNTALERRAEIDERSVNKISTR